MLCHLYCKFWRIWDIFLVLLLFFLLTLNEAICNNSKQQFPAVTCFFSILRGHIELDLSIVTWSTKILKDIGGTPLPYMIEWNLGRIWKTHLPRCPKITFPDVFQITFYAFNIKWTKWNECQLIDIDWCFVRNFCVVYWPKARGHLTSSKAT